jgi:hypothetical protein
MSLTGANIGVDATFLAEIISQGQLDHISTDATKISSKCDVATDEFRDAAIEGGYLNTDVDALTGTTLHVRWREYIGYYAIDALAVGIGVPDDIRNRCTEAKKHFSFLATGHATIDGLTKIADSGGVSSQAAAERAFDRNNTSQDYALRNPKI